VAPLSRSTPRETGIRVLGEWLNISQYHPVSVMPTPGELVEVQVERTDRGAWITSLQIVSSPLVHPQNSARARETAINRLSVLKTAAAFLGAMGQVHEGVKSDHVIPLAERWLAWVEQEGEDDSD
jgi:hypothetical protein